jgi:hypothetical protein
MLYSSNKEEYRKKILIQTLEDNKLEYKNHGDCYSYIKRGYPDINTIIKNEITKITNKTNRKIKLAKRLYKLDITLDEDIPSCYNYINDIGCKSLNDIVKDIEIEHFFKYNTNFDELIKIYYPSKAKDLAMKNYLFNRKKSKHLQKIPTKIFHNSIVLSFD